VKIRRCLRPHRAGETAKRNRHSLWSEPSRRSGAESRHRGADPRDFPGGRSAMRKRNFNVSTASSDADENKGKDSPADHAAVQAHALPTPAQSRIGCFKRRGPERESDVAGRVELQDFRPVDVPGTAPTAPPGSVIGAGTQYRLSPQAYYYAGPFGLRTEYVLSSQQVRLGSNMATLTNRAASSQPLTY
jgi:hypothetical protein